MNSDPDIVPQAEIFSVLRHFNPWWDGTPAADLPQWKRAAFSELFVWLSRPPAHRAVFLSGARQVGKTTLLRQAIHSLLDQGVPAHNILYATFDHPILKLIGLQGVLKAWSELRPPSNDLEYLILDEIQYTNDWATWLKHQTDFEKKRRIAVTGSAIPLSEGARESGVGRWHTIKLPTLSFSEFLQIKGIDAPDLPEISSLLEIFQWKPREFSATSKRAAPLVTHFHDYLLRGGFPQTALVESLTTAQKLLREDIIDKVLKRDMTALFGVRHVLEMEKIFLYLCLHDGGILDLPKLCGKLELKRPTVSNFIDLLEASNLIYKLRPFGYGKEILRSSYKIYLADAAIPGSVLLKGRTLLEDGARLGAAAETAFFHHVFTRYYQRSIGFSFWRGKKDHEVDIVAETNDGLIPFEVKYQKSRVEPSDLRGLSMLCEERKIDRAYIVTRDIDDFEIFAGKLKKIDHTPKILKIPAPLACFWLSRLAHKLPTE